MEKNTKNYSCGKNRNVSGRIFPVWSPAAVATITATGAITITGGAAAHAQAVAPPRVSASAVNSPTTPFIHLVQKDMNALADALRSVARQCPDVAFVAEGRPFRARNSTPPLASVAEKWPEAGLPIGEAVKQIALAYDYDAERNGDVFLLRKRFTHADDLPDLPSEELRLAFRDAAHAVSGVPAPTVPVVPNGEAKSPFAWTLYQSLTPAQQAKLTDPAKFLFVSELNANQKQMLRDCAQSRFIQSATSGVLSVSQAIEASEQKATTFDWREHTVPGVRLLGCTTRANGADTFSAFAPSGWMRFTFGKSDLFKYAKKSDGPLDKAAPMPADYDEKHEPLPPLLETGPDTFTLQTLADVLIKKEASKGKNAPTFSPREELAAKSVLVVGIGSTPSETLWRAAGTVYGLRAVRTDAKGPLLLLRPRPRIAQNFGELTASVAASLPPALLRLQDGALVVSEVEAKRAYPEVEGEAPVDRELRKLRVEGDTRFNAPEILKRTIFHRLRVLLEPRLDASPNGSVLYRDMSREEHDLWALALTIDQLKSLSQLGEESVPATLTNFDKGWVHAFTLRGYGDVPARTALSFLTESPTESGMSGNAEIGNIPPIKTP